MDFSTTKAAQESSSDLETMWTAISHRCTCCRKVVLIDLLGASSEQKRAEVRFEFVWQPQIRTEVRIIPGVFSVELLNNEAILV